jgi:hypothetical protein
LTAFLTLPTSVRRAAIAGIVVDGVTGRPVAGVQVTITKMPPAFKTVLAVRARLSERAEVTITAPDGGFRFVDLPDGAYTLSFALPNGGRRYGGATADFVVARDAQGKIPVAITAVKLPPTGVSGQVRDGAASSGTPVPLARVRVDDGCGSAYSGADGRFYLTGEETGKRSLVVSASGFSPATVAAQITEGQVVDVGPVVLKPLT